MTKYASLFGAKTDHNNDNNSTSVVQDPYSILIVDDEPNIIKSLRRVFRDENYNILTASDGIEALHILEKNLCHLMISDYMMPNMNGAELLREVKKHYPDTIRIMLTGHADTTAVMSAIKDGAVYKFILKPWHDDDLRVTVALALEQYELKQKNKQLQDNIEVASRDLEMLSKLAITNRSQLAILLQKKNLLNNTQLQEIYKQQQFHKKPVLTTILDKGWVKEPVIRKILRKDLLIREIDLNECHIDPAIIALVPRKICEQQYILPIAQSGRHLTLAMADPMDEGLIEEFRFSLGLEIDVVMADTSAFCKKFKQLFGDEKLTFKELETIIGSNDPFEGVEVIIEDDDEIAIDELLSSTEDPPAVRMLNAIILEAVRLGASDIHIHPRSKYVVVRYRIDGVLLDKIHIPTNLLMPLVSRVKVMAELDITERRRPQDGRITAKTPLRIIDLRISTLPTINGEKIVMRILDRNAEVVNLDDLGMSQLQRSQVSFAAQKPQGIILTTGPTGSGKTTTLYSLLQTYAQPEKNYVTIEDPVEYYLDMAGQVMVKEKTGLSFAKVLRAILRQDPDVILLGEIRDFETAEVAFHAALTGHLVFSSLHTNSSIATIARLTDLGLKPFIISSALSGIITQRLVRKICSHCRQPIQEDQTIICQLGPKFQNNKQYFNGAGCDQCNGSGYKGRLGLYEVLIPSEQLTSLIARAASTDEMFECARSEGMITLLDDAFDKVKSGLTTVSEIMRVLGPQSLP